MRSLAELKRRQADRKLRDVPLAKLFGPDQAIQDIDDALNHVDQLKLALRDLYIFCSNNGFSKEPAVLDAENLCE